MNGHAFAGPAGMDVGNGAVACGGRWARLRAVPVAAVVLAVLFVSPAYGQDTEADPPRNLSVNFVTGVATWGANSGDCGGNYWRRYRTSPSASYTSIGGSSSTTATVTALQNPDYGEFSVSRVNAVGCVLASSYVTVSYTATTLSSSPATLSDTNLNGATLTVTLGDDETTRTGLTSPETFLAGAAASHFTLATTGITGLTVSSVSTTTGGRAATVTLSYPGGAVADGATIAVEVAAAAHSGVNAITSRTVAAASAAITATNPATLTEGNLNNATLTLTLTGTTFGSGVTASSFTLGGMVPGLQVSSVSSVSSGDTSATLTLGYSGANFDDNRPLSVTVAASALALSGSLTTAPVNVSPTRSVALSTFTLTFLSVNEGDSETYTAALGSVPTGPVTVTITGAQDGVSANPTSLSFTASNWDTAQTVTVAAAADANIVNETVTLTHTASGADYGSVSADLVVRTVDSDAPSLRVRPTTLTVEEESSGTYAISLNTQPSATVTVTVGSTAAEVTVDTDSDTTGDQTTLTFTDSSWDTSQTVTVSAADDDDAVSEVVGLTHAAAGGDYTGLALAARPGVAVTVDDRDVATVALSRSSLALFEGGGSAAEGMWTVRLANLAPTGPVSVTVTSGDPAVVLTGAPVTLNFTTANWDTAQTVTARAVDDDNATSERVDVRHAATGANYGGAEAVLRVVVTDDEEVPPDAPAGLAATPGDGSAVLSWSNPENPALTRYQHRYAEQGAPLGTWVRVAGAGAGTTSLTVSGLVNGRAYVFEVRAGNAAGDGEAARTAARLTAVPGETVQLPDAALAAAVRAAVGKSAGQPLTAGDLARVLVLDVSRPAPAGGRLHAPQTGGAAVKDLRGIEALVNLRRLNLDNNEVADLSPLLGLAYFERVSARGNPLSSDSVFVHAAALRARGVEVLLDPATVVLLPDPGLRRAVELALGKSPGATLTEGDMLTLTSLRAESAGVASLSGLEAASRLESLTLSGNAPPAGEAALDIEALSALRSLSYLDLSGNGLSDISALAGLSGLRTLLLGGNAVEDLSLLSGLTGLTELTLSDNGLADISALAVLTALEQLWLDGNALMDVAVLSGLRSLRYLHLGDNRIEDLAPLAGLAELRRLWLPGNHIADVSALAGLRLTWLDLSRNRVANISPLAGLPELSLLRLGWNQVADVAPLVGHEGLAAGGALGLRANPLGVTALEQQVPALREAGAAVVAGWAVPLFPAASAPSGRGGFVRVLNRSEAAGEVLVEAVDEAGMRFGPARLALGPRQAAHFNSGDLADGNARKGLPEGVGPLAQGSWRLVVSSVLDIEVLSYLRGPDGFVTAAHGALPRDGERLSAFVFNPGADRTQRSSLRVLNPGASSVQVSAWGVDDAGRGRLATGFAAPAGGTLAVTARELESSRSSGPGLGRGEGKWRLAVGAPWPVEASSLLESPGGHLSNLSSAHVQAGADGVLRLPLFPSASDGSGRQGFARVANLTAHDGWAEVSAVDDAGVRAGPARLRLPARATVHFDAAELEAGNVAKGISPGLGAPTSGSWRLELRSALDLRSGAYARHADGFLTSLHEAAPSAEGVARVAVFNPASNERQRSLLRLVNNGEEASRATITGRDDAGAEAGPVSVTVPAGEALTLTAVQLEEGGEGLEGALGNGEGKWRLSVASDGPLVVMSLMENPTGHLANLSATARP